MGNRLATTDMSQKEDRGVTARHSSSGRQPNFAALNRRRHLYSAVWPSRWALAQFFVFINNHVIFSIKKLSDSDLDL